MTIAEDYLNGVISLDELVDELNTLSDGDKGWVKDCLRNILNTTNYTKALKILND